MRKEEALFLSLGRLHCHRASFIFAYKYISIYIFILAQSARDAIASKHVARQNADFHFGILHREINNKRVQ